MAIDYYRMYVCEEFLEGVPTALLQKFIREPIFLKNVRNYILQWGKQNSHIFGTENSWKEKNQAAKEEKLRQIAAQAENMMQVCLDQGIKLERLFRNLNFSI